MSLEDLSVALDFGDLLRSEEPLEVKVLTASAHRNVHNGPCRAIIFVIIDNEGEALVLRVVLDTSEEVDHVGHCLKLRSRYVGTVRGKRVFIEFRGRVNDFMVLLSFNEWVSLQLSQMMNLLQTSIDEDCLQTYL